MLGEWENQGIWVVGWMSTIGNIGGLANDFNRVYGRLGEWVK